MLCTYDRTIFENRDTGFSIVLFRTKDEAVPSAARSTFRAGDSLIRFTAVGYHLPTTSVIDVDLDGNWEKSRYGLQLSVERCTEIIPKTKDGIIAYLCSDLIKGIGEKRARAVVDRFGMDTLDIIEHTPERLLEIKGISEKKLRLIVDSYLKSRAIKEIVSYLAPYGISTKKCSKIHEEFGSGAMGIVKESPYELCRIPGFGFRTVDDIAKKTERSTDDPRRIRGALQFVLEEAGVEGHLYLEKETMRQRAYDLLNEGSDKETVPMTMISSVLSEMVKEGVIIHDGGCFYQPRSFLNEIETAKAIAGLLDKSGPPIDLSREIIESCRILRIVLSTRQLEAVNMCMNSGLSVITGGPGTGKTTVLKVILDLFMRLNPDKHVLLTAPTGRAARRMEESTGHPAQTLHSALGLTADTEDQAGDSDSTALLADFIIIDESSMVDMALAKELFTKVKPGTKLLLVGDSDQLPSVGAGNVLREMMRCGEIAVTVLDLVFRQSDTSRIALNAKAMKEDNSHLLWGDDFVFLEAENPGRAADIICEEYYREIARKGMERVEILSPFKSKGDACVKVLNDRIREHVNPHEYNRPEVKYGMRVFRLGDRVLQTRNLAEISNGDVGVITDIYHGEDKDSTVTVTFGERTYEYALDELDMLEHAYAMTIHKSQGSEYDTVIIPILSSHFIMLRRNLIYTAITRAKKKVILVGEKKAIFMAIHKNDIDARNTRLAERIIEYRKETGEQNV